MYAWEIIITRAIQIESRLGSDTYSVEAMQKKPSIHTSYRVIRSDFGPMCNFIFREEITSLCAGGYGTIAKWVTQSWKVENTLYLNKMKNVIWFVLRKIYVTAQHSNILRWQSISVFMVCFITFVINWILFVFDSG